MEKQIIARWESKGSKYAVEVTKDAYGYGYRGLVNGQSDSMGNMGALPDDAEAISRVEKRLVDFQADANMTPMRRTL
jgi:hypothetical protein